MTLEQILDGNNTVIRQKVLENSIDQNDVASRLDVVARYSFKNTPFAVEVMGSPAIAGGARLSDYRMQNEKVESVTGSGFLLFDTSDFTKNDADDFIDFPAGILSIGTKVMVQIKAV